LFPRSRAPAHITPPFAGSFHNGCGLCIPVAFQVDLLFFRSQMMVRVVHPQRLSESFVFDVSLSRPPLPLPSIQKVRFPLVPNFYKCSFVRCDCKTPLSICHWMWTDVFTFPSPPQNRKWRLSRVGHDSEPSLFLMVEFFFFCYFFMSIFALLSHPPFSGAFPYPRGAPPFSPRIRLTGAVRTPPSQCRPAYICALGCSRFLLESRKVVSVVSYGS